MNYTFTYEKWCVGGILNARDGMLQCYSCFSAESDGILVTTGKFKIFIFYCNGFVLQDVKPTQGLTAKNLA